MLGDDARAEIATHLSSHGARLASWSPRVDAGRTYARASYHGATPAEGLRSTLGEVRIDDPALIVLDVVPAPCSPAALERLQTALSGRAAPAGIVAALRTPGSVLVELDEQRTPLALAVDLIDVELAPLGAHRSITPISGLGDDVLARFAGSVLGTPDLDAKRLIETFSEPLLEGRSA